MKSKLKAVFRLLQNQARRLLESSPGSNSSTPKALLRALSFSSTSKHKPEEMAESAVKSWWLDKIHQNFKPLYEKTLLSSWSDADWWLGSPRFEVYRCDWFLWKVFCLWDGWCPRRVVSSWGRTPWCFHCVDPASLGMADGLVVWSPRGGRTPWCFHCADPASLVVDTDFRARWPLKSWPCTPLMARRLIQLVGWRLSLSPLRRNETDEKSLPSLEDWSLRLTNTWHKSGSGLLVVAVETSTFGRGLAALKRECRIPLVFLWTPVILRDGNFAKTTRGSFGRLLNLVPISLFQEEDDRPSKLQMVVKKKKLARIVKNSWKPR